MHSRRKLASRFHTQLLNRKTVLTRLVGRNAQQQKRINPYLRYQSLPTARGSFQSTTAPAQRSSIAAADVVRPQGTDGIGIGNANMTSEPSTPVTPPGLQPYWWVGDPSYTEPRARVKRRRSRRKVHFQEEPTSALPEAPSVTQPKAPAIESPQVNKRHAYHSRCPLDVGQCLPFGHFKNFVPFRAMLVAFSSSNK